MISRELQNRIMLLAIVLYSAYMIFDLGANQTNNFWDFEVYYYAVDSDLNIYSDGFAPEISGEHGALSYKYPPLTKYLFAPFTMMDIGTAKLVWFTIIIIISGLLVYVFSRMIRQNMPPYLWLVLLFGFNACLYTSLQTGNINVLVCLLVYLGFANYLSGNYKWFIVCILMGGIFKFAPLVFLVLLWFEGERKLLYTALLCVMGYVGLNALTPEFPEFVDGLLAGTGERGIINPSLYTFYGDIQLYLSIKLDIALNWLDEILYFISIVVIAGLSWKSLRRAETKSEKLVIVLLTGLLILPRIKNYEYLLIIPIAIMMVTHWRHYVSAAWIVVIFVLSALRMTAPGTEFVFSLLWDYYPLILLVFMWYKHIMTKSPYQLSSVSLESQIRG